MSLYDRLVPTEALRWGWLTREPYEWHADSFRYVLAIAQATIAAPFMPVIERLCQIVVEMCEIELRDRQ